MNIHDKWILRYSNCWEDADLLVKHITDSPGKRLLSVASGGENSLSLLVTDPAEIVVVDMNPIQLYLFELKKAAISILNREDYLKFSGYEEGNTKKASKIFRRKIYNDILSGRKISREAADYWSKKQNLKNIEKGIIHQGYFERNMRFFACYLRPLLHSTKNCKELMRPKTAEDQELFYHQKWDSKRWRFLFRLIFSKPVLRMIGPDATFFNYTTENVTEYLKKRFETHFSSQICQDNFMLHYGLFGSFGKLLPHYVQEKNYNIIKGRLDRISIHAGAIETLIEKNEKFDGFNLSNIFDYTIKNEFKWFAEILKNSGNKNAKYVYWNVMQRRKLPDALPAYFYEELDSFNLPGFPDKGINYIRMCVDRLKN